MHLADFPFPVVNAILNGTATVLLTAGFVCIKNKKIWPHRLCMTAAFCVSVVFLVSYVSGHIFQPVVHFGGTGGWRTLYFTILISHMILAVTIVPLVLRTLWLALHNDFARHRAWAKWTFPMWYYVSVTGVIVYFFLFQWFPHT